MHALSMYIHWCTSEHIGLYVYNQGLAWIHMLSTCVHIDVLYIYVNACACMRRNLWCISICTHIINISAYMYVNVLCKIHINTHIDIYTFMYMYIYIHIHMYVYIYIYIHTYIYTYTHMYKYIYIYIDLYICTWMQGQITSNPGVSSIVCISSHSADVCVQTYGTCIQITCLHIKCVCVRTYTHDAYTYTWTYIWTLHCTGSYIIWYSCMYVCMYNPDCFYYLKQ